MLIFNYPYTDLYSLNLDWIIKAIKEVQQVIGELGTVVNSVNGQSGDVVLTNEMITSILGSVVNSVNGQAGAVVITKEMLTTILEGVVNSFNGRSGTVQLLPADVNATRIDITWTSDPGDTIGTLTQAEIDALYADGKRVLIFVNNVGSPDQIYFLTIVGDVVTPQPYTPTAATSGVLSVNGQSGVVTLNADNLPVALGETDTIGAALDSKQAALTFDNAPTANSANPVTSGGVYTADQSLGNAITTLAGTVNQHSDQIANLEYFKPGDTFVIGAGNVTVYQGYLNTPKTALRFFGILPKSPENIQTMIPTITLLNVTVNGLTLDVTSNISAATMIFNKYSRAFRVECTGNFSQLTADYPSLCIVNGTAQMM